MRGRSPGASLTPRERFRPGTQLETFPPSLPVCTCRLSLPCLHAGISTRGLVDVDSVDELCEELLHLQGTQIQ
ncbi:hypothetical protein INR49_023666 [Caranx melampygus]|nr:hypothetical protein INR49_023666 [Caranx melampygus]